MPLTSIGPAQISRQGAFASACRMITSTTCSRTPSPYVICESLKFSNSHYLPFKHVGRIEHKRDWAEDLRLGWKRKHLTGRSTVDSNSEIQYDENNLGLLVH